jgi:peroxiredoxin Q/BCP
MAKKTKSKKKANKKVALKKATKKATKKASKKTKVKAATKKAAPSKKATSKKAVTKAKTKSATKKVAKKAVSQAVTKPAPEPKVHVGEELPPFTIHATGGKVITSDQLKGKKVVLYFYPKDATPGCTIEGRDFTKLHDQFKSSNTEVFGISRDDLKSHESFKEKEGFCFDLLSDETGELSETFGVWKEKNMYGKTYMGIERSTFIIDENGVLKKEWRGVKVEGHAEEVLNSVKNI